MYAFMLGFSLVLHAGFIIYIWIFGLDAGIFFVAQWFIGFLTEQTNLDQEMVPAQIKHSK